VISSDAQESAHNAFHSLDSNDGSAPLPSWIMQSAASSSVALSGMPPLVAARFLHASIAELARLAPAKSRSNVSSARDSNQLSQSMMENLKGSLTAQLQSSLKLAELANIIKGAGEGTAPEAIGAQSVAIHAFALTHPILSSAVPASSSDHRRRNRTLRALAEASDAEFAVSMASDAMELICSPIEAAFVHLGDSIRSKFRTDALEPQQSSLEVGLAFAAARCLGFLLDTALSAAV